MDNQISFNDIKQATANKLNATSQDDSSQGEILINVIHYKTKEPLKGVQIEVELFDIMTKQTIKHKTITNIYGVCRIGNIAFNIYYDITARITGIPNENAIFLPRTWQHLRFFYEKMKVLPITFNYNILNTQTQPKIYQTYAPDTDITFILKDICSNDGDVLETEVTGFYYGSPNELAMGTYKNSLVATFD
jgi:hypothetical protein